ncbi:unnamed protein product [Cochlearia groenlandica]
MGKYIKKSNIAGDLSVKNTSPPVSFSLRTRSAAKNLSLHRLRSHLTSPSDDDGDSFRYLQLRSRRLVKLPLLADKRKQLVDTCETRNPRSKSEKSKSKSEKSKSEIEKQSGFDSNFDFESLVLETTSFRRREEEEAIQSVPSSREIEDFFAYAEQKQQRFFIDKYNFDIVSENPLPGRYEWIKVVA